MRGHASDGLHDETKLFLLFSGRDFIHLARLPSHPNLLPRGEKELSTALLLISAHNPFATTHAIKPMSQPTPLMQDHAHSDATDPTRAVQLYAHGQFAKALAAIEPLLQSPAASVETFHFAGICLLALGQHAAAEMHLRRVVEERPDYAEAHNDLSIVLLALQRRPEAEAACRRALALRPDFAEAHNNLGRVLYELHRWNEAEVAYLYAISIRPDFVEAHCNLGGLLVELGELPLAELSCRRAIAIRPEHAMAHNNLAAVLFKLDRLSEAEASYRQAIAIQPHYAQAHYNLGCVLKQGNRINEAELAYRHALAIRPDYAEARNNLGTVLMLLGASEEGIAHFRHAIACGTGDVLPHSNLAYNLTFVAEESDVILDACRRFAARYEAPLHAERLPHANDRTPTRRLRIGYVSPDFCDHCQALFTVPLLSHHDHTQFEIFCYASVHRPDVATQRIAGFADVWRDVRQLDDRALAQQIRDDSIDILVDLSMHMADGRPLLFARKPAPVQVAWLAYPGTTGLEAIDYRLTDPRLDPPGTDHHYSERSLRLPDAFWCYDPLIGIPAVNALPALTDAPFTFGCLNNLCKLTDRTLAMWAAVLREVQPSRLLMMAPSGAAHQRLVQRMELQGIDIRRVVFVPRQSRLDYLHTYHQIDLGLDTFPYNGHTTSLDSLWMGVPVVTRVGNTCVGRGGLSQLYQLGLTELAGDSDEAFVRIAVELAKDLPRLAQLRQSLRLRMEQSPLMDGQRFARHIEDAYRFMWQEWCRYPPSNHDAAIPANAGMTAPRITVRMRTAQMR